MTGQLRTALHAKADEIIPFELDLASITRSGDRRARRRRVALAGGLAGVLGVVGGATVLAHRDHGTKLTPAGPATIPLTYAVGSVIHSGDTTVDVGRKVASFVPTARGFVFSTPDLTVYEEHDGDVRPLSQLASAATPLVASADGQVAAWFDGKVLVGWPGPQLNLNTVSLPASVVGGTMQRIEAVSDGHLWYWTGHATRVQERPPLTSSADWKDDGFPEPDTIRSAAGDRVLMRVGNGLAVAKVNLLPPSTDPSSADWQPGTDVSGVQAQVSNIATGTLAPDGDHWFTQDADQFAVFDSGTGHRLDVAHPGFAFAAPYQWLGNDTIAALALRTRGDQSVSLLTCRLSRGTCEVTAPDIGPVGDVTVPDGRRIGD